MKLIKVLGLGWLAMAIAGFAIQLLVPMPTLAVLVDRSYCPPEQWGQLVQQYDDLYRQHQQGQIKIEQVIAFSDLGQETLSPLPTPAAVQELSRYGRPSMERRSQLTQQYPNAPLLGCS